MKILINIPQKHYDWCLTQPDLWAEKDALPDVLKNAVVKGIVISTDNPTLADWTSVEDELPAENEAYFVTWEDKFGNRWVGICAYDIDSKKWLVKDMSQATFYNYIKVVAWAPLPDSYKD